MLTRPFTRLVVAFGIRKITQRRLVEEVVTGILLVIPFGLLVGLLTSRICTKIRFSRIRSDVWTTLVVFLIGDVLMEWLLPSLGCLPVPASDDHGGSGDPTDDDGVVGEYVSSIFRSAREDSASSSFFRQDEYHYTFTWLLQSYGLYCPPDFANSDSLLTPDATAILFSVRLIFLCIGVHIGESIGCFVALTGGIATGKSTAAKMFVDCNYNNSSYDNDFDSSDDNDNNGSVNESNGNNNSNNNNNNNSNNNNNKSARNRRNKSNQKKKGGGSSSNANSSISSSRNDDYDDDELIEFARARDEDAREGRGIFGWISDTIGAILSAFAAFALTDDESGGAGYNEGTVQLICADSIAHSILLPPEVLADRLRRSPSSSSAANHAASEGEDDDDDQQSDGDENVSGDENDSNYDNTGNINSNHSNNVSDDQTRVIRIVSPSDSVYHQILKAFEGKDILNPNNGQINRLKLGAIIFNDREERKKLNKITHPRILIVLLKNLVRSVFFGFADITMGDLPLLFESGRLSWLFGVTICVVTSEETQLARLIKRNPELPREECQARIDSQLPLSKKIRRADIVIDNNGDLEQLREQVEEARRDIMGRLYGIGMSLLQMLLLIGGSTSIAVSSKFYTHWQQ